MRVLVTGANGFVGQAAADALERAGHDVVRGLRQRGPDVPSGGSHAYYGDLSAETEWAACLADVEAVVHAAGLAHVRDDPGAVERARGVNTEATIRLAASCRDAGVSRLILISTAHVLGPSSPPDGPLTDASPPRPAGIYAASKLAGEIGAAEVLQGMGTDLVVLRPPMVYGSGAPGNFGRLVRLVQSGLPLPLGGARSPRSFIGIDNLASAIAAAVSASGHPSGAFLVADAETPSAADLVEAIAAALGRPARLVSVPRPLAAAAAGLAGRGDDVARLFEPAVLDTAPFCAAFGWMPPVPLAEGVARAVADTGARR